MKLVADSGSTKTSWALQDKNHEIHYFVTRGHNPYYYGPEDLQRILYDEVALHITSPEEVTQIWFYGSGCSSHKNCLQVSGGLQQLFTGAEAIVNHDLFGAARALLHDEEGIACILGTGSNSCVWNGEDIIDNVPSLGYLLSDEGSGTTIGRNLLRGLLLKEGGEELLESFYLFANITFEGVLDRLYGKAEPNRFMSSVTQFASHHMNNPWITSIINNSLDEFIENNILKYEQHLHLPLAFTGSIAHHFSTQLEQVCAKRGLKIINILKDPIEGLASYHLR